MDERLEWLFSLLRESNRLVREDGASPADVSARLSELTEFRNVEDLVTAIEDHRAQVKRVEFEDPIALARRRRAEFGQGVEEAMQGIIGTGMGIAGDREGQRQFTVGALAQRAAFDEGQGERSGSEKFSRGLGKFGPGVVAGGVAAAAGAPLATATAAPALFGPILSGALGGAVGAGTVLNPIGTPEATRRQIGAGAVSGLAGEGLVRGAINVASSIGRGPLVPGPLRRPTPGRDLPGRETAGAEIQRAIGTRRGPRKVVDDAVLGERLDVGPRPASAFETARRRTSELFDIAESSPAAQQPVGLPGSTSVDDLVDDLQSGALFRRQGEMMIDPATDVPRSVVRGVRSLREGGRAPTVLDVSKLRRNLNSISRTAENAGNDQELKVIGIVKRALDDLRESTPGQGPTLFRRAEEASNVQNFLFGSGAPKAISQTVEGKAAPNKFIANVLGRNSSADDLVRIRSLLLERAGPEGEQAWQTLREQTFRFIDQRASGTTGLSQRAFQNTLRDEGLSAEKLNILFPELATPDLSAAQVIEQSVRMPLRSLVRSNALGRGLSMVVDPVRGPMTIPGLVSDFQRKRQLQSLMFPGGTSPAAGLLGATNPLESLLGRLEGR